ncbi:MAG: hypothetical protein ABF636_12865 [Acetobacter sp.]
MKTFHKFLVLTPFILALSACGKGEPSKDEVSDFLKSQALNTVTQEQNLLGRITGGGQMSDEKKKAIMDKLNNEIKVEGVKCTAVDGFNNVYDCNISTMMGDSPVTSVFRFTRKSDGTLAGEEKQ